MFEPPALEMRRVPFVMWRETKAVLAAFSKAIVATGVVGSSLVGVNLTAYE